VTLALTHTHSHIHAHSHTHIQTHTHINTNTHSVGLLGTSDRPAAQTSNCTTHNIHKRHISEAPGGIRNQNTSKRAAVDPRLSPRGYWDRQMETWDIKILLQTVTKNKPFHNSEALILSRYRQ